MAKKTAAEKRADEAAAQMDSMFGVDVVPMGDASLRVRRVLSRAQQKTAGNVLGAVQNVSYELNKLIAKVEPDENGDTPEPMSEEDMTAAAEALEETMHTDLIRGLSAFLVNPDDLDLGNWGTPALSQLFMTLQQRSTKAVANAVASHFPPSGPSA